MMRKLWQGIHLYKHPVDRSWAGRLHFWPLDHTAQWVRWHWNLYRDIQIAPYISFAICRLDWYLEAHWALNFRFVLALELYWAVLILVDCQNICFQDSGLNLCCFASVITSFLGLFGLGVGLLVESGRRFGDSKSNLNLGVSGSKLNQPRSSLSSLCG